MRVVHFLLQCVTYLWAFPNTLIGLFIGIAPFLGHRTVTLRRGVIGIYGPAMKRLLILAPIPGGAAAITLGHTILAVDELNFEHSFEHEWIHVRQYQWWGPFFIPAYLLNSLWHWLHGDDLYIDNDFERQARNWSEKR